MSAPTDGAQPDDDFFVCGDVVEHKMNTNVFGIVIGFMGSLVGLRVSPSLEVLWFHEWELRVVDSDEYDEPVDGAQEDTNVIPVDFTKKARLDGNTKTKGRA